MLFGKKTSVLARPSHEGGAREKSGQQGSSIFGKKQDRLAPPSKVDGGGKAKNQPTYRAPASL